MTHGKPEGPISETIHALRLQLADSPAWQTASRTQDRLDAIKRIHGQELPFGPADYQSNGDILVSSLQRLRPFIQVYLPDGGFTLVKDSTDSFELGLILNATIEVPPPEGLDDEAADNSFTNLIGNMCLDLMRVTAGGEAFRYPYGDLKSVSAITAPYRSRKETDPGLGECFACRLALSFGTGTAGG